MISRYLLAFVLSAIVMIGWVVMTRQRAPEEEAAKAANTDKTASSKTGSSKTGSSKTEKADGTKIGAGDPTAEDKTPKVGDGSPTVGAAGVGITWRDGGASIGKLSISNADGRREVIDASDASAGPLGLSLETASTSDVKLDQWSAPPLVGWTVDPKSNNAGPWIHSVESGGLKITRGVSVIQGAGGTGRTLRVQLVFENPGADSVTMRYQMHGPGGLVSALPDGSGRDIFVSRGVRDKLGRVEVKTRTADSINGVPWITTGSPVWIASGNADLIAACWPDSAVDGVSRPIEGFVADVSERDRDGTKFLSTSTVLESRAVTIRGGGRHVEDVLLYIGPREPDSLERDAPSAKKLRLARANQIDIDLGETFRLTIDSATGSVDAIYLLRYFVDPSSVEPRVVYRLLREPRDGVGFLSLEKIGDGAEKWKTTWALSTGKLADGRDEIVLEKTVDNIRVRKRISMASAASVEGAIEGELFEFADGQLLHVSIELENIAKEGAEEFEYVLYGPSAVAASSRRSPGRFIEVGYGYRTEADTVLSEVESAPDYDADDPEDNGRIDQKKTIVWFAVMNSYFTALLFPIAEGSVENFHAEGIPYPSDDESLAKLVTVRTWIQGSESLLAGLPPQRIEFGLYLGPRKSEFLADDAGLNFEGVNDYGFFNALVHFFMWLLGALGSMFSGSYRWGWAIISLTVIVKLCLHPVNRKSQRSMMRFQKKMQKIQPEMTKLKEKHGGDRARYSQDVQKLWKKHGVNPGQGMMSCLIMLLQLPIWIGLYQSLEYAIDLRQAEFFYIVDLTQQDRVIEDTGLSLPLLGSALNLLPIFYVILTLVNQRLQPRPTDPQMQSQYKMMTFMMIVFGFIFYTFPAGFMLYIMTSSALGIIESKIIKAGIAKEDDAAIEPPAAPEDRGLGGAPTGGGGTSPGRRNTNLDGNQGGGKKKGRKRR
jgi:YidC/Oxa1 family membrane protein insertase